MKVNFSEYTTRHCEYCANTDTGICYRCECHGDHISVPSQFFATDKLARDYFNLLADYSKMLTSMGFKIER